MSNLKRSLIFFTCVIILASCKKVITTTEEESGTGTKDQIKTASIFDNTFKHPGVFHSANDIAFIKSKINTTEPWKSAFTAFKADKFSDINYVPRQLEAGNRTVERGIGGTFIHNVGQINDGANAAFQQAMMYALTNNHTYADKALEILLIWSDPNTGVTDFTNNDARLQAGIAGFRFAAAAELLKHTPGTGWTGWNSNVETEIDNMFRNIFYNEIKVWAPGSPGNWDAVLTKCMMAMAVYLDDTAMFNKAVDHFYNRNAPTYSEGSYTSQFVSNGCLDGYIKPSGQTQESGRDQVHVMFGLGSLAEACEIGLNQGLDMYGALDNRLLKGFEYTANYVSGNPPTSYVNYINVRGTNTYSTSISPENRFDVVPTFEIVANHYARRKGLLTGIGGPVHFTNQMAVQQRPEGRDLNSGTVGWGTLLFTSPIYYPGSILTNGGFSSGTSGWYGSGCAISSNNTELTVTGRTNDYNGPRQNILSALNASGKGVYDISAQMKKVPLGTGTYLGKVTVKLTYGGQNYFYSVKENFTDSYNLISGNINLQWSGTLTAAEFYIETDGSIRDFAVDRCTMVKAN